MLKAHCLMMTDLVSENGRYRSGGVGVFDGDKCIHLAPQAMRVPSLMRDLLMWAKNTTVHPLISSCVFHYEFEFIHPFITFMLRCLLEALLEMSESNQKSNQKSNRKILDAMRESSGISIRELQEITGLSESGVKKIIRKLREDGIVKRVGGAKGGHWEVLRNIGG